MTAPSRPWWHYAACKDNPDLFFGSDGETAEERAVREADAIAICRTCPARIPCRRDAMGQAEHFGVAGGMTADERRAARRRRLKREAAAARRAA